MTELWDLRFALENWWLDILEVSFSSSALWCIIYDALDRFFLQLINTLYCIRKFCLVLPVIRTLKTKLSITDIDKANAKATTNWWNYSWNLLQPVSCCVSCMKRPATAVASTGPGPDTQEAALSPN